jgi:hypothetical protein
MTADKSGKGPQDSDTGDNADQVNEEHNKSHFIGKDNDNGSRAHNHHHHSGGCCGGHDHHHHHNAASLAQSIVNNYKGGRMGPGMNR